MKQLSLVLLGMALSAFSFGQKLEVSVQVNGGLSRFGGVSASNSTVLQIYSSNTQNSGAISPYGKRFKSSYGASVQFQRVSKTDLLLGLEAGVESLQSRVNVRGVSITPAINTSSLGYRQASGQSDLRNDFINLQPFIGKRLKAGTFDLDVTIGSDIGIGLNSKEEGTATDIQGEQHKTSLELNNQSVDIRPRVGVTANYQRVGLSASYANGLVNYVNGYSNGAKMEVYSRVFRLGVLYRLTK
ncbi:hypothetical protein ACFSKU_02520 [Pontibacter silvestris]|uniref:Outer membrane protein beta-barrel domain-containing protein n=1 Tax=Pontibacter silvestris TaxID=2305183 RepID=A0ABW4WTT4_9BACT|nr:hypothetical protein [Pontibacter silvestris]MCC9137731.1 hypothetical protein [Pontibacter silvestris]